MIGQDLPITQKPSRRVLVLDFDAPTLITLERQLEGAGFDTTTTWNVHEAYGLLEQGRFDLIVVGDHPPHIDAVAILRRLDHLHRLIPSIVMRVRPNFSIDPEWSRLVTTLSSCNDSEVLDKVCQRLRQSNSTRVLNEGTAALVASGLPEPVVLRMMSGNNHAQ